jgi:hemoglobin/transferrin/lactoferrin receptor protein
MWLRIDVRNSFILIWFILYSTSISGQNVRVLNAQTGEPVANAVAIAGTKAAQADGQGMLVLDLFGDDEPLSIRHSSFMPYISTKSRIIDNGSRILLTEDPLKIDEIVISASRWEQAIGDIPYRVHRLEEGEIERFQAQTTADLLGASGAAFIQKSQMGGGSPMIRGFAANRVLLVVDGIRMNNAIYRSGNLHNIMSVDVESIGRTELVYGPSSVMYGSDALGGVMSFYTISPRFSASENNEWSGKVKTRWSGANNEKTVHGQMGTGSKNWALTGGISFSTFGDLRMGSHGPDDYLRYNYAVPGEKPSDDNVIINPDPEVQIPTAFSQLHLNGKLRLKISESVEMTMGAYHSETSDIPRYDRLILSRNNQLRDAVWNYGPQKWSMYHVRLDTDQSTLLFDRMKILGGYQEYTESRHERGLNEALFRHRLENLQALSGNVDFIKKFDDKNELYYGTELFVNHLGSSAFVENIVANTRENIPPRYPDESFYATMAGYMSWKTKLGNSSDFQVGGRYTRTRMKGKFDPSYHDFSFTDFLNRHGALSGNVGFVRQTGNNSRVYMNLSTGFRSPNIDDAAKVFESVPGNVVVPNPALKPEYAVNAEAGLSHSWEGKAKIEASVFTTKLFNAMVRRNFKLGGKDSVFYDGMLSKVEALVNAESANVAGADLLIEYELTTFLSSQLKYSHYTGTDSDGYPLRHVPPAFGSWHLIYKRQSWYADLFTEYSRKYKYDQLAPDERDKPHLYALDENGNPWSPGWMTMNLRMNYRTVFKFNIYGGIDNILDKRYRPYSSGIAAPGRNFFLVFSYRL